MIMLTAGLQTVPDQLLRAAKVDGASAWQRFWHVTFPHLRGVSTVTILLLAVANFNSFIIPWIMTGAVPRTPPISGSPISMNWPSAGSAGVWRRPIRCCCSSS